MGARYYNGNLGRFLSEDPAFLAVGDPQKLQQATRITTEEYLSNPQHLNSYSYAFNNPLVYIDEDGKFSARTLGTGALQIGKAGLSTGQTIFQAGVSGMAYGTGLSPLGTVMGIGALSNLDSSFEDSSNGLTNVINGLFTEKEPVLSTGQGPIRDIVQKTVGDTKMFDGIALGANVITFTGKEAPEYLSRTGSAYKIYQNAKSVGGGQASLNYLAQKAAGFMFEAADVTSQIVSGGRGILDFVEKKLGSSSSKKNN